MWRTGDVLLCYLMDLKAKDLIEKVLNHPSCDVNVFKGSPSSSRDLPLTIAVWRYQSLLPQLMEMGAIGWRFQDDPATVAPRLEDKYNSDWKRVNLDLDHKLLYACTANNVKDIKNYLSIIPAKDFLQKYQHSKVIEKNGLSLLTLSIKNQKLSWVSELINIVPQEQLKTALTIAKEQTAHCTCFFKAKAMMNHEIVKLIKNKLEEEPIVQPIYHY